MATRAVCMHMCTHICMHIKVCTCTLWIVEQSANVQDHLHTRECMEVAGPVEIYNYRIVSVLLWMKFCPRFSPPPSLPPSSLPPPSLLPSLSRAGTTFRRQSWGDYLGEGGASADSGCGHSGGRGGRCNRGSY